MKIDRNIISSLYIVFSLGARVGLCDVCTDVTNVIKVDDVNNSDGKASIKRKKSPETTANTQGIGTKFTRKMFVFRNIYRCKSTIFRSPYNAF